MIKQCPNCQSERLSIIGSVQKTARIGEATDTAAHAKSEDMSDNPRFDDYRCLDCTYEFSCRCSDRVQRLGGGLASQ
jgi:radical SAM protein with 4Fe4S-binding SPASM domain